MKKMEGNSVCLLLMSVEMKMETENAQRRATKINLMNLIEFIGIFKANF